MNVRFYLSHDIKITFISDVKTSSFCHDVRNVVMDVITWFITRGLSILLHGIISLPDAVSYDK